MGRGGIGSPTTSAGGRFGSLGSLRRQKERERERQSHRKEEREIKRVRTGSSNGSPLLASARTANLRVTGYDTIFFWFFYARISRLFSKNPPLPPRPNISVFAATTKKIPTLKRNPALAKQHLNQMDPKVVESLGGRAKVLEMIKNGGAGGPGGGAGGEDAQAAAMAALLGGGGLPGMGGGGVPGAGMGMPGLGGGGMPGLGGAGMPSMAEMMKMMSGMGRGGAGGMPGAAATGGAGMPDMAEMMKMFGGGAAGGGGGAPQGGAGRGRRR